MLCGKSLAVSAPYLVFPTSKIMYLFRITEMAESRDPSAFLSPLEEQFIQESEADEDIDQQLLHEREIAAHRLWASFQDSATAVSHLFRGVCMCREFRCDVERRYCPLSFLSNASGVCLIC